MKIQLVVFLLLMSSVCSANMASPIYNGTRSAIAYSSKNIDILSEQIDIKIDEGFNYAEYTVVYNILSNKEGNQIPLLFLAIDFSDNFQVWVDDVLIKTLSVPEQFKENDSIQNFLFPKGEKTLVQFDESASVFADLDDLKYFEADLKKGNHKIIVRYKAEATEDRSDWISKYRFTYSLTPAKFWKSFGKLTLNIIQEGNPKKISVKAGTTDRITKENITTLLFNSLPGEYIEVSFSPVPNKLARLLIAISPFGLMLISGIILIVIHIRLSIKYRLKNPGKFNYWVLLGSVFLIFMILAGYLLFEELIDVVIGVNASGNHGYSFLIFIFYPIIMPIYLLIIWFIDKMQKKKRWQQ